MRRKELLELDALGMTDEIYKIASKDQGKEETEQYSWGKREITVYNTYGYIRAGVQNGILKLEIYKGEEIRRCNVEPACMIYMHREERRYETWIPQTNKWSRAKCKNLPCWGYELGNRYRERFWISEEERQTVLGYLNLQQKFVFDAVEEWQTSTMHRKELDAIDKIMDQVTETPADFRRWAEKEVFWEKEYLFYSGKEGTAYCTACESHMKLELKSVHNKQIRCPKCGRRVTAKSWKRQKSIGDHGDAALIQKIRDGYIVRKFYCLKTHNLESGWVARTILVEDARQHRSNGLRQQKEYEYKSFKGYGNIRWCFSGYANTIGNAVIYPYNLDEILEGTKLQNIPYAEILTKVRGYRIHLDYFFSPYPIVEYLAKTGLARLALECVNRFGGIVKSDGKNAQEALGINGNRIHRLQLLNGGSRILSWLRYEQKAGKKIRNEILIRLDENGYNYEGLKEIIQYGVKPERAMNYIEKQKGSRGDIIIKWRDYLNMAKREGYDMGDDIVRYPKDLRARHAELIRIGNDRKECERLKQYQQIDRKIRKRLADASRYNWQNKKYIIIPAEKCEDLMKEGRALHHCVGRDDYYMKRMAAGRTWILFLREKERPEEPYYTIEIDMETNKVLQYYSAFDRQPDGLRIRKVLDMFERAVKQRRERSRAKATA